MQYLKIYIILVWTIITRKCLGLDIDVFIPNENYNIYNINELVNLYSNKYHNINIYFKDTYFKYEGERIGLQINIPANTNVSLIGNPNSGTVIDFSNNIFYTSIVFNEYNGQQFKVENITFYHFIDQFSSTENDLFFIPAMDINFKVLFKNCIFDTSNSLILSVPIRGIFTKQLPDYQIIIDSCQFK